MPPALAGRYGQRLAPVLAYQPAGAVSGDLPLYVRSGYAPSLAQARTS